MITIGSRVKYIKVNTEEDIATGYYPPIGTLGTVKIVDDVDCLVKWDKGTDGDNTWWCDLVDVEKAQDTEHLDMMIDWCALTEKEQITLHALLRKAHSACI